MMIAFFTGTTTVFAQQQQVKATHEKEIVKVPAAVEQSLQKQYPGITAEWVNKNGKYEASFMDKNKEKVLLYNANGTLEETAISMLPSRLPLTIKQYIEKRNLGIIRKAVKITKADGTVEYAATVEKSVLFFNQSGNFVREMENK